MGARDFADISNYTDRFQAQQYRRGGSILVGILATDGVDFTSGKYGEQAAHAHEAGLNVWHYHFARPERGPIEIASAEHFWKVVRPHYRPGDRLVLDVERHHPGGPGQLVRWTHGLDAHLHHISGVHAALYTDLAMLGEIGRGWRVLSGDYWIAAYSQRIWTLGLGRRLVAQQTGDGQVGIGQLRFPGIGPCDANRLPWWYGHRLLRERRRRRQA